MKSRNSPCQIDAASTAVSAVVEAHAKSVDSGQRQAGGPDYDFDEPWSGPRQARNE